MGKKSIEILKRALIIALNSFLFIISLIIPKTDKIVIVGGWFGNRFADNSKHFFLYLHDKKNQFGIEKVVWITRNKTIREQLLRDGYDVYKVWSIQSIWYHLRAKVHVIDQRLDDINPYFSIRSVRINLWHGFPMKKIGTFMKSNDKFEKAEESANSKFWRFVKKSSRPGCWGNHYVLATSEFSAKIIGDAFDLPERKVIVSGYPRNYEPLLINPIKYTAYNENADLMLIKEAKKSGKKIIGYFPTFRDKANTLLFGTEDEKEISEFFELLEDLDIMVIAKFHFAGKYDQSSILESKDLFINLEAESDVYTYLSEVDVLITDYSSIYYDFLLWKRPIIFFPYDLEYYSRYDRGLLFDYNKFTPGPKVYNLEGLKEVLSKGVESLSEQYCYDYGGEVQKLSGKIFGNYENMKIDHLMSVIKTLK